MLLSLLLYGAHSAWLALVFLAHRRAPPSPPPSRATGSAAPWVTVQLPIYNERLVAARVLAAVGRLDWPVERLMVQVLDDSDDGTVAVVAGALAPLAARGITVEHLRRTDRSGYKAGALAAGLPGARGEFLLILDADFVPAPDLLRQLVPEFDDGRVGFVQARWEHLDREHGWLTRAQALAIDGHFGVEQAARHRGGCLLNFNGTAGLWRRAAIEAAGGWSADTLTEDLDLSYRTQLAGWKGVYRMDVAVPAELPPDLRAFLAQQRRWAQGSIETALKLLPRLWSARLGPGVKLLATLHLTHYLVHPLLLAAAVLAPLVLLLAERPPSNATLLGGVSLLLLGTLAPISLYLLGQRVLGRRVRSALRDLSPLMLLGTGVSVSNTRAVLRALLRQGGAFERTPKHSLVDGRPAPPSAYDSRPTPWPWAEAALALWSLLGVTLAVKAGAWPVLPFLMLHAAGFLLVACALARGRPPRGGIPRTGTESAEPSTGVARTLMPGASS